MQNKKLILPEPFIIVSLNNGFQPQSSRSWARDIKKLYNNCCVISNLTDKETSLVSHHLYSKKDYFNLEYSLLNGIPLSRLYHLDFHKKFGQKTTPSSFIHYLELLIRTDPSINKQNISTLINWITFLDNNMIKN